MCVCVLILLFICTILFVIVIRGARHNICVRNNCTANYMISVMN